jgi:hypothetical protein
MGGPGDYVNGCGVESEIEDFGPSRTLLTPDEDFAIITCRCEDVAIFWMGPGDRPDGAFVAGGELEG